MTDQPPFDVLIIGGSYAGLSAAMTLGRSMKQVLVIDSGQPCNRQTPHAHNFITHDGVPPAEIAAKAKAQVLQYDTVRWHNGLAVAGAQVNSGFTVETSDGSTFSGRKLIFATGVQDLMPPVEGFAQCWGISVLHCPYCHGYEVRHQQLGLIGNGDLGFEFCRMLHNWSPNLTLFTNGPASFSEAQRQHIGKRGINIVEAPVVALEHNNGYVHTVVLADGSRHQLSAIFAKPQMTQHCTIPALLGCALTEQGLLQIDAFQRTTVKGIFAAGDNSCMFRTVSMAAATGTMAGAMTNRELIEETF